METSLPLLENVIGAINAYKSQKIERNIVKLQREIDALVSKTSRGSSLKFFNPAEVIPAECLTCLVDLVAEPQTKSTLLLKCLLVFNNLVSDSHIRESLHEDFHLTAALASVIRVNGGASSDTLTAEALRLLQKVTYGQRISFQESYMENLIRFLLSHVCSPATGLTEAAMGTLVNLTRDNFSVQSYLKNNVNMVELSRTLTKLLGDNHVVVLFSLTLLANVCLAENMASKFYSETNVPKTFQLAFNVLFDGDSGEARRYAVDLFKDILKVERFQRSLAKASPNAFQHFDEMQKCAPLKPRQSNADGGDRTYMNIPQYKVPDGIIMKKSFEYLGSCVEQTLKLLMSCSPDTAVKMFEFIHTLCRVSGIRLVVCKSMFATFQIQDESQFGNLMQTPLSRIADPLLALIHWAGQSPDTHGLAPAGAYTVLQEVYEELVFSHDKVHHEKHAAAILPTILHTLNLPLEGDNSLLRKKFSVMVKAVKLLITFCHNDYLLNILSKRIDMRTILNALQYQFDHNPVCKKSRAGLLNDDWSGEGVDLVLSLLDLLSHMNNAELSSFFMETMQDVCVVPFLVYGLRSGKRERVENTLSIITQGCQLESFPLLILGDTLAQKNGDSNQQQTSCVTGRVPDTSYHYHPPMEDKENREPGLLLRERHDQGLSGMAHDMRERQGLSGMVHDVSGNSSGSSIQSIIEQMGSKMEVRDPTQKDIIAVYERSLQSLQTKEVHLQDLLEAKTLALTQADRMLSQLRSRKGQDEAESNRLRSLLLSCERKSETLQHMLNETTAKKEKYFKEIEDLHTENAKLAQIAEMHQQLTVAHTELAEKHESLQKALLTKRQEHKSLEEMHEMLQKHNANLKQQYDTAMEQLNTIQEDRRKVATQLKTAETKLSDTIKSSMKWEYDYKRSEEERETMDQAIEKLRGDISKSEKKKKEFQEQVKQLEFVCNQNETKINSLEEEIGRFKAEIEKHRQITALINSLSGGGGSDASVTNARSDAT